MLLTWGVTPAQWAVLSLKEMGKSGLGTILPLLGLRHKAITEWLSLGSLDGKSSSFATSWEGHTWKNSFRKKDLEETPTTIFKEHQGYRHICSTGSEGIWEPAAFRSVWIAQVGTRRLVSPRSWLIAFIRDLCASLHEFLKAHQHITSACGDRKLQQQGVTERVKARGE